MHLAVKLPHSMSFKVKEEFLKISGTKDTERNYGRINST